MASFLFCFVSQVWLEHDADWIYQGGPTGNLHDVYYNQCVPHILLLYPTVPCIQRLRARACKWNM